MAKATPAKAKKKRTPLTPLQVLAYVCGHGPGTAKPLVDAMGDKAAARLPQLHSSHRPDVIRRMVADAEEKISKANKTDTPSDS